MIQWPSNSKIICFNSNGEIITESKRSRLDLSDTLMLNYNGDEPRQCTIEVSTKAEKWKSWNSDNVRKIENHIKYDLEFDGYNVEIHRVSKPGKTLCSKPFQWSIKITSDYSDDEPENSSTRTSIGSRFKIARSDASVKTIQSQIEKVFGLPKGCVCLLTPENKKSAPRLSIKKMRSRWKNG